MKRILHFFYPPNYASAEAELQRRIRLGVNICLAFVLLLFSIEPLYLLLLGSRGAGLLILPATALFVLLLFLLRSGRMPFAVFAHVLISATLVVQTINICTTGGPASILIAGYIDMQIMAALLVGRSATFIWIGLTIATPCVVGLLELNGVRLPYTRLDANSPQVQFLLSIGVMCGAGLFVFMLKSGLDSTLHQLSARNDELAAVYQNAIRAEKLAAELEQQHRMDALRERIARDLHDDVGSTLSAINIYSSVAEGRDDDRAMLLRKISESSGKVMEAMSDIVWSISHSNERLDTVLSRMRSHAISIFEEQDVTMHFDLAENLPESLLPPASRKDFYLIYKEAVNNISKYAAPAHIWVRLSKEPAGLELCIRDDGRGFNPEQVRPEGNGLRNMRTRAAVIGANLELRSEAGAGTEVRLLLPGGPGNELSS